MDFDKVFSIEGVKFTPKKPLKELIKFNRKYKKVSNFNKLLLSNKELPHISHENYLIQINDNNSVKSYYFSIYSNEDSKYIDNNGIFKRFHSIENCLYYKMSMIYKQNYKNRNSIKYKILKYKCNTTEEWKYINDSYKNGVRILL